MLAVVVIVTGLTLAASGQALGTWLPPFVMRFEPRLSPFALVSIAGVCAAVLGGPALLFRVRAGWRVAAISYAGAIGVGLAVNLAREGTRGWWGMFATGPHGSFEGTFEYLPGLPLLRHGAGFFLAHFPALLGASTTHIKGNPPGPLIVLSWLGIHSAGQLATLCVLVGGLCAPLAYVLGRTLGTEARGRAAAVLTVFSPAMVLFGVSSLDYAFAALGMLAACLLVSERRRWWLAGAIAAAVATFFSWLLFAIPAWAAVVVWRRRGLRRAAVVALASAAAIVAFDALLGAIWGYDPFAALSATHGFYVHGAADARPYAFWLLGSPVAWAAMLGLPIVWRSVQALLDGDPAAIALWLLIVSAALLGLTKAETERIWLPFVPLACVAAAGVLSADSAGPGPAGTPGLGLDRAGTPGPGPDGVAGGGAAAGRGVVLLLAGQALLIEILFFTIW